LEKVIDRDDQKLSRYFAIVAYTLLGGTLHTNRVMGALGAVIPTKDMSAMSAYFVRRTGAR
jgi:hypothetical protein